MFSLSEFQLNFDLNFSFQSSPPPMSPTGRSQDVDAIVNVIQNADKFIHISVMDYVPMEIFTPKPKYVACEISFNET